MVRKTGRGKEEGDVHGKKRKEERERGTW